MICIVQRVTSASVIVAGKTVGQIGPGLAVLAAVERDDTEEDIRWTANKLVSLRIFRREEKHFDIDVREAGGSILLVSNFTIAAATRQGRRPSFDGAAPPEMGKKWFNKLVELVSATGTPTATGEFGADMLVMLANDGPATFVVQSRE